MNDDQYGFACIISEEFHCGIEARDESRESGWCPVCGGTNHPDSHGIPMPTNSPFVDGNGHPLDHDTAIAVFKALEYRRGRYGYSCFMVAMVLILSLSLSIIAIGVGKGIYDYYGRRGNAIEYFPEKSKEASRIIDCKFKRILYFSGKSREYVCPDGSLVVVGRNMRNKEGE